MPYPLGLKKSEASKQKTRESMRLSVLLHPEKHQFWKGKKMSQSSNAKRRLKLQGKKRPPFSVEHKQKMSQSQKGKPRPNLRGEKHGGWQGGLPHCLDCGVLLKSYVSARCYGCNGKLRQIDYFNQTRYIHDQIRALSEYARWRMSVYQRDNFTCQMCGRCGSGDLVVHHKIFLSKIIKEYKIKSPDEARNCYLLWDLNNGVTLCNRCHSLIHFNQKDL